MEYTYCGQNTSTIPLTIVRLVDDRLGVVLDGDAVVAPGATLCHTDVSNIVTYTIREADAGSVINNNTVVTVRTQEAEPREFQAIAAAVVAVPRPGAVFVTFCHSRSVGAYEQLTLPSAAVDVRFAEIRGAGGHNSDSHQGGRDIIPPGDWDARRTQLGRAIQPRLHRRRVR